MIINKGNLQIMYTAFKAAFAEGLGQAQTQYGLIATTVPSTTGSEEYGWLGSFPNVREWLGDRVINGIETHGYTIKNKTYENTIGVPREKIEDDQYGIYAPMATELGRSIAAHPDQLVFGLIAGGASALCYDGQYFFDTDHPVKDAAGAVASQANWDNNSGSGTPWYLLDCTRALKPIILQERRAPNFVSLVAEDDANVFMRKEYLYGVDCRRNVGYGFWQLAYGSRKGLDETNLVAAYTAMTARTGDGGRPLGIKPNVLLVPPSLEFSARKLVEAAEISGTSNVMKGLVQVIASPWLA